MTHLTTARASERFATALALAVLIAPTAAQAQEQEWMVRPSKEHELLKKDVGTWEATVKVWPTKDADPIESKGTEKNELLKGGMWLVSRFEGEAAGMPFTGVGTYGYDPVEKKYVGTWIDSMTPHLMITESEYDAETKTMTGTAKGRDAVTKQQYTAKLISRYIDDDTRTFEMHMPDDDSGHRKTLEIHYKRRSK